MNNVLGCYDHLSHPATKKICFFVIATRKSAALIISSAVIDDCTPPNHPATKNKNKNLVREMKETCS